MAMTKEQAIALANARKRAAEGNANQPDMMSKLKRQLGLTGRAIAEGVVDIATPFADPLAYLANKGIALFGGDYRFPSQGEAFSNALTEAGVPEPQYTSEKMSNIGGRIITGMGASAPITKGVSALAPSAPPQFAPQRAATNAGRILERNQVPLTKAQASGRPLLNRLSSAMADNPVTTGKQQAFTAAQQKAFNKSVLRAIGEKSDEATQEVMRSAKDRIGNVFDKVGGKGANFDDALQTNIVNIVDEARATVPQSGLQPLIKNVDDLLNSVDESGKINGEILIKIRSRLSKLSRNPEVGQSARAMHDALIDALERSNPGDKGRLAKAVDQWRSLRIIEGAIGKGLNKDISPLRLSNALATKAQRNASIYGVGGNQNLVELAQAGRSVIPEALPQSGTVPRGLMQAPLRSLTTGIPLSLLQRAMLAQPKQYPSSPGLLSRSILPFGGLLNGQYNNGESINGN